MAIFLTEELTTLLTTALRVSLDNKQDDGLLLISLEDLFAG